MIWEGLSPPYASIVVDPPWPQSGGGRGRFGPGEGSKGSVGTTNSKPMPYATMTLDQITALPVADLATKNAHLYLWATNRFLPDAFRIMAAWGFSYSTTLVWTKEPMGGGLGGAYGIATEYVLFGYRGQVNAKTRVGRNWFTWKRPYSYTGKPQHSAKPAAFQDMVEQVSPEPYVELFARAQRLGWDSWGWGYERSGPPPRANARGDQEPADGIDPWIPESGDEMLLPDEESVLIDRREQDASSACTDCASSTAGRCWRHPLRVPSIGPSAEDNR